MRRSSLYYTVILLVAFSLGIYSCRRENNISNDTVIETPYTVFFADTAGVLYKTNDGMARSVVFQSDGYPARAICTSEKNILMAKSVLTYSSDNGRNFNRAFDSLQWIRVPLCASTVNLGNAMALNLNQSMIIDIPDWNRVYTATNMVHDPGSDHLNYLGVEYSNNHGVPGSWATEATYDTNGRVGVLPVRMISYTRLTNGVLCGLAVSHVVQPTSSILDTTNFRCFYKTCGTDDCKWMETTDRDQYGALKTTSSTPLPPYTTYPDTGFFSLGHFNDRLIAIDQTCHNGAFYSDDTGRSWKKYAGLPVGTPLLCVGSPFEQVCLIGTLGRGLYIYNPNTQSFQPNNAGLTSDLIVRSITWKENYYKNKTKKRFVYIATNKGIFQSVDDGINWVQTIPGNYVAIY